MNRTFLSSMLFVATVVCLPPALVHAQVVQPVIAEYTRSADGVFQVKNEGAAPQIVTLEPKSFSLDEDGNGVFRTLDPSVHLELSATSVRLEPGSTARIFYKVNADALPAWLCIYASFSPAKEGKGVNLRIMLPHTIYVYGKDELQKSDIVVSGVSFDPATHHVTATLENRGQAAGRVAEVEVSAGRASEVAGGFPMLPGSRRKLSMDWSADKQPEDMKLRFAKFQLKLPIAAAARAE